MRHYRIRDVETLRDAEMWMDNLPIPSEEDVPRREYEQDRRGIKRYPWGSALLSTVSRPMMDQSEQERGHAWIQPADGGRQLFLDMLVQTQPTQLLGFKFLKPVSQPEVVRAFTDVGLGMEAEEFAGRVAALVTICFLG